MTQEKAHNSIIDRTNATSQQQQLINAFNAFDNNEAQDATCPFFNVDSGSTFFNVTPRSRHSKGTSSTRSFASATRAYETISLSDEFRIIDPLCSEVSDEEYEQWNKTMELSLKKEKTAMIVPQKQIQIELFNRIETAPQAIPIYSNRKPKDNEKAQSEKPRKANVNNNQQRKDNSTQKHSTSNLTEQKSQKKDYSNDKRKDNSKDFRLSKHTRGRSRVSSLSLRMQKLSELNEHSNDINTPKESTRQCLTARNERSPSNNANSLESVEKMIKDVHQENHSENNQQDNSFCDFKTKPLKSSSIKTNSICETSSHSKTQSFDCSPKSKLTSGNKLSECIPQLQSRESSNSLISSNSSLFSTVSDTESSSFTSTASVRVSPPTSVIVSPKSSNDPTKAVPPEIPKLKLNLQPLTQTPNQTQNQQLTRVPNSTVSVNPSTQLRLQLSSTSPVSLPQYCPIPTSPTCLLSPRSAFIHSPRKRFEALQTQTLTSFHEQPKPNVRAVSRVVRRKKAHSLNTNETNQENYEGN